MLSTVGSSPAKVLSAHPDRTHSSVTLHFLQQRAFHLLCPLLLHPSSFLILGANTHGSGGLLTFPCPGVASIPRQRPRLGPRALACSVLKALSSHCLDSSPGTFLCMDLLPKSLVHCLAQSISLSPLDHSEVCPSCQHGSFRRVAISYFP